jgi:hypothetical protein
LMVDGTDLGGGSSGFALFGDPPPYVGGYDWRGEWEEIEKCFLLNEPILKKIAIIYGRIV